MQRKVKFVAGAVIAIGIIVAITLLQTGNLRNLIKTEVVVTDPSSGACYRAGASPGTYTDCKVITLKECKERHGSVTLKGAGQVVGSYIFEGGRACLTLPFGAVRSSVDSKYESDCVSGFTRLDPAPTQKLRDQCLADARAKAQKFCEGKGKLIFHIDPFIMGEWVVKNTFGSHQCGVECAAVAVCIPDTVLAPLLSPAPSSSSSPSVPPPLK